MNQIGTRPSATASIARRAGTLLLAAWLASLAATAGADEAPAVPDSGFADAVFADTVQPIFRAKCHRCHGAETQKSALNLSTRTGVRKGGESGPILDLENLKESTLYQYVQDRVMPPEGEGELTDAEIAAIGRWIEAGAKMGDAPQSSEAQLSQHDVLPTLLLHCVICHGRQRREAELDVRSVATLLKGGKSGPAIVPGKPDESLLVTKIRGGEMPPRKVLAHYSVKPVPEGDLATIEKWIAAGAREAHVEPDVATAAPDPLVSDADRQFWAFQPPRQVPVPKVAAADGVRSPIDAFVLARLKEHGLALSPEADRRTLVRRVYFDLVGLPPEVEEVEAFVADARPDAYERLVDRVLASSHYGERWGQYWLDVAGYSDSEGIQHADDIRPNAWRYRD
jgi:mono/diheme cytochrome c family protein